MKVRSSQASAGPTGHPPHQDIARWSSGGGVETYDELRVTRLLLLPEMKLHLAQDAIILWARLEAEAKSVIPAPFWASAWVGGQALARYLLDHPRVVAGKRVLDLASGSGMAAIAAAMAGAAGSTANDIDPYAMAAIRANAKLNQVQISIVSDDLLHEDADLSPVWDYDVVMAGDGLYDAHLAAGMLRLLRSVRERGGEVLVGDPDRGLLPHAQLRRLASYPIADATLSDAEIKTASVYRLSSAPVSGDTVRCRV